MKICVKKSDIQDKILLVIALLMGGFGILQNIFPMRTRDNKKNKKNLRL